MTMASSKKMHHEMIWLWFNVNKYSIEFGSDIAMIQLILNNSNQAVKIGNY